MIVSKLYSDALASERSNKRGGALRGGALRERRSTEREGEHGERGPERGTLREEHGQRLQELLP